MMYCTEGGERERRKKNSGGRAGAESKQGEQRTILLKLSTRNKIIF